MFNSIRMFCIPGTSSKIFLKWFSIIFLLGPNLLSTYCFTVVRIHSRSFRILFFRSSNYSEVSKKLSKMIATFAPITLKNIWTLYWKWRTRRTGFKCKEVHIAKKSILWTSASFILSLFKIATIEMSSF